MYEDILYTLIVYPWSADYIVIIVVLYVVDEANPLVSVCV